MTQWTRQHRRHKHDKQHHPQKADKVLAFGHQGEILHTMSAHGTELCSHVVGLNGASRTLQIVHLF